MSRVIAACRNKPDNDQGTREFCEKIFMRLQPENVQQILKAQNFNSLNELGNFTNRFHSQIVSHYFDQNRTTTNEFKYLADKVDELSTEICNVKKQSQFQKPHNSSYYDKRQSKANRTFCLYYPSNFLPTSCYRYHSYILLFWSKNSFPFLRLFNNTMPS